MAFSPEAMAKALGQLPDAVTSAVGDLKGGRANLSQDLRTLGDYFRDHGGRRVLDAYMRATFSEADLAGFQAAAGGPGTGEG